MNVVIQFIILFTFVQTIKITTNKSNETILFEKVEKKTNQKFTDQLSICQHIESNGLIDNLLRQLLLNNANVSNTFDDTTETSFTDDYEDYSNELATFRDRETVDNTTDLPPTDTADRRDLIHLLQLFDYDKLRMNLLKIRNAVNDDNNDELEHKYNENELTLLVISVKTWPTFSD
jgi:hypothetical protein